MTFHFLNIISRNNKKRLALALLLICSLFYGLYAVGYDFNKFSLLAKQRYGDNAYNLVVKLDGLLQELATAPEAEKLRRINLFFNQHIEYGRDIFIWDKNDYWASPLESIGRGAGDCEDFTIAKYIFLKVLNVPNEKLRLIYAKVRTGNSGSRGHMVLAYYAQPRSEPLILDNFNPFILPASQRDDLNPVFSFSDKGIWAGTGTKSKGSASQRLSKWRNLLVRIHADGLN